MDVSDELRDLEGKIQVLPWTGVQPDVLTPQILSVVKSWLLLKGMPKQKVDNLKPDVAAKCYAVKNYYETVIGNRPRKIDYKTERRLQNLLLADAELEPPLELPVQNKTYTTDYDYEAVSEPTPNLTQDVHVLEQKLQSWIENVALPKLGLDAKIGNRAAQYAVQTEQNLVAKFNNGEIKVQFSDQAKQDIKTLVHRAAREYLDANAPAKEIIINIPEKNLSQNVGHVHREFPTLIKSLACKLHVMLVGTASSSKTTSAKIAAKALDLPFYHMGAAASEFKYAGYEDGHGKYHSTPFRMAFENGGVILLDEYDAGIPAAQMFVQAALANYTCHFPDKIVEAHEDFVCLAACNTYGRGSDRQFTSRNQQDAAALDRFVVLDWDIDEDLEAQLFGDGRKYYTGETVLTPSISTTMSPGDWVRHIQKIRRAINDLGERHLVTMRASDFGARLLNAGLSVQKVEQMCVWKGLNPQTVEKIQHQMQSER